MLSHPVQQDHRRSARFAPRRHRHRLSPQRGKKKIHLKGQRSEDSDGAECIISFAHNEDRVEEAPACSCCTEGSVEKASWAVPQVWVLALARRRRRDKGSVHQMNDNHHPPRPQRIWMTRIPTGPGQRAPLWLSHASQICERKMPDPCLSRWRDPSKKLSAEVFRCH